MKIKYTKSLDLDSSYTLYNFQAAEVQKEAAEWRGRQVIVRPPPDGDTYCPIGIAIKRYDHWADRLQLIGNGLYKLSYGDVQGMWEDIKSAWTHRGVFVVCSSSPLASKKAMLDPRSQNTQEQTALLFDLGVAYLKGWHGVAHNEPRGIDYLMQASRLDVGPAHVILGQEQLCEGLRSPEGSSERHNAFARARDYLQNGAQSTTMKVRENSIVSLQFLDILESKNPAPLCEILAMYGYTNGLANYYLGYLHYTGLGGLQKNYDAAAMHFKMADERGVEEAARALAILSADYFSEALSIAALTAATRVANEKDERWANYYIAMAQYNQWNSAVERGEAEATLPKCIKGLFEKVLRSVPGELLSPEEQTMQQNARQYLDNPLRS